MLASILALAILGAFLSVFAFVLFRASGGDRNRGAYHGSRTFVQSEAESFPESSPYAD